MRLTESIFLASICWVLLKLWEWKRTRRKPFLLLNHEEALERRVVENFLKDPTTIYILMRYIKDAPAFNVVVPDQNYLSVGGRIKVVYNSLSGYKVNILPREGLIDEDHDSYGLSREKARALLVSVLTRVPGSPLFRG